MENRDIFKPTDRRDARLRHVGFCSPVACIRGVPVWSLDVWRRIIEMCVLLRGCSKADAALICGTGRWLPYVRLSLKRAVPWKCRGQCAGGPSGGQGWRVSCPACNEVMLLPAPPAKQGEGWSFGWCPKCLKKRRLGRAKCCKCLLLCMHCRCDAGAERGRARTLLELWGG